MNKTKNTSHIASDIVLLGTLGDLSGHKLLPALFQLELADLLPHESKIIGVDRTELTLNNYIAYVEERLHDLFDDANSVARDRFLNRLLYQHLDMQNPDDFKSLAKLLTNKNNKKQETPSDGNQSTRVFYFSTPPRLYGDICAGLAAHDLITSTDRVVLEKPIGSCLATSKVINNQVSVFFNENQIYRIDHYLGKETVLNLLVLRFANTLFTNNWDRNRIDHVQITVAEEVGIEGRWGYYDGIGQMRDMVQNHLLQILSLIAMEPPADLSADSIRNEKLKVLKALVPINKDNIDKNCVRGQYRKGIINGQELPGYLNEDGANPDSNTESFVAIKAEINNWRWAGVPFYLRTGKRLHNKQSEIVIHFKKQPHNIFKDSYSDLPENKLSIRLQPDEGVDLSLLNKIPGISSNMHIHENILNLSFSEAYSNKRVVDAYERLILEIIHGNQSLFVSNDEIEAAWKWADSIIETWQDSNQAPEPYPCGSWGPMSSITLIARDGREWDD